MNTAGVSLDAALTRARLQADTLVAIDESGLIRSFLPPQVC